MEKIFGKRKIIWSVPIAGFLIFLAVHFSKECSNGILSRISFCVQVLIPSLFIFMAVSSYIVKSGAAQALSRPLAGLSRGLFRLPAICMPAILLSMIGGYPVGARCVEALFERGDISRKQAEKCAYIAVAAGPGFILNYVGLALLNSKQAGFFILIAQIAATILTGVIVGYTVKVEDNAKPIPGAGARTNLLVDSVLDAARATGAMCAMVVIFSAVIEIVNTVFAGYQNIPDLAASFLEVTTGCNRMCGRYPLPLIAFFIGFGGLSVHFQIFAALNEVRVRKLLFFLFRIIEGIITAFLTYILVSAFPLTQPVFSSVSEPVNMAVSSSIWGSGALVFSSLCFLFSISKRSERG